MKSIDRLKAADGLKDVAKIIGFKPRALSFLLYKLPVDCRYTQFSIPKATGGVREIMAPVPQLKLAQRRLAGHLQNCLQMIEKNQVKNPNRIISHGFKRDLSIATNAGNHVGRRWVLNMDLVDFFPSINFGRVRGFFIKNKNFFLKPATATVLAQISCHKNALPQGAPTSPVISNLIAGLLDIRLNQLASGNRCSFTRYADDITFSTNLSNFPVSIATQDTDGCWKLSSRLSKRIRQSGFSINNNKTRMQYRRSRQDVTGLIVNSGIGVKRETLKTVRAQVESIIRSGACHKVNLNSTQESITPEMLNGRLAHIAWVKGRYNEYKRVKKPLSKEPGYVRTYRRFLDHQAFVVSPTPTIICEGPTDRIYLQCAIKSISKLPKNLTDSSAPSGLGVRLFRFTNTTSWIQRLNGGTGDIKNLIASYNERMQKVGASKFQSPVILVVDNDSGADPINSAAKECSKSKHKIDGTKDFYHIMENLYLVHTPKTDTGEDTMIETFLPEDVKKQKLGIKTLDLYSKKLDKEKNFGKTRLAENIVKRQKNKIDFSGYSPLLTRISKAIEHFENNKS